jgi:protein-arginine kinase activator protein McsA
MISQMQLAKQTVAVELKNLGYSTKEVDGFQKTTKCPRCGMDFSNLPFSGRWLAHLANCKAKPKAKKVKKTKKAKKPVKAKKAKGKR